MVRRLRKPGDEPVVTFDPAFCPLLDGLDPEEQQARMVSDPIIRNCIRQLQDEGDGPGLKCRASSAYAASRKARLCATN